MNVKRNQFDNTLTEEVRDVAEETNRSHVFPSYLGIVRLTVIDGKREKTAAIHQQMIIRIIFVTNLY